LKSGTRYKAVKLEGDRKDKVRGTQLKRAVYCEETSVKGDPMYERDRAEGDRHRS
jgi:hypothetical protein